MSLDLVQNKFQIQSKFMPSGDQPNAIKLLTEGLNNGVKDEDMDAMFKEFKK